MLLLLMMMMMMFVSLESNEMNARLVFVHRIQHNLKSSIRFITLRLFLAAACTYRTAEPLYTVHKTVAIENNEHLPLTRRE